MPSNLDIDTVSDVAITTSETTIAHNLGRTPLDGIVIKKNGSANIYRGTTAWTSSNIYLIASAAVTATLVIF